MIKELTLSAKYSVWQSNYKGIHSKEVFLKYVGINDKLATHTSDNSICVEINSDCFNTVNNQIKKEIETISNRKFNNYAEHYWVYTQTKGFDMEWMHQHLLIHPHNRSSILTDYTFTYYIQTPTDTKGDEGCIIFETEDKVKHTFLPKEGDIFIFPSDLRHTAIPTPNSNIDRVVYAGSLCIDIENQKAIKKSNI